MNQRTIHFCRTLCLGLLIIPLKSSAQSEPEPPRSIWKNTLAIRGQLVGSMRELPFDEEYRKLTSKSGDSGFDRPTHIFLYSLNWNTGQTSRVIWSKKLWAYENEISRPQISFLDALYDSSSNLVVVYRQDQLVLGEVRRSSQATGNLILWKEALLRREFASDNDIVTSVVIKGSIQGNSLSVVVKSKKSPPLIARYRYVPKLKKAKWEISLVRSKLSIPNVRQ